MQYVDTVRPTNLPTTAAHSNPFLQAATEASGGGMRGRLLKFNKGEFLTSDDTVSLGTEFAAHINEVARGWTKFVAGKLIDQRLVKVVDGLLPSRESLGDLDETVWESDAVSGKPKDPWVLNWYLPLSAVDSGDGFVFTTGSHGGIGAIGRLCNAYGRRISSGTPALPIIKLGTSSYKHKTFGKVVTPEFTIAGWEGVPTTPDYVEEMPAHMREEIPYDSDMRF